MRGRHREPPFHQHVFNRVIAVDHPNYEAIHPRMGEAKRTTDVLLKCSCGEPTSRTLVGNWTMSQLINAEVSVSAAETRNQETGQKAGNGPSST